MDIFKFAERFEVRQDESIIRLEDVYIPMRMNQARSFLPLRNDLEWKEQLEKNIEDKEKLEDLLEHADKASKEEGLLEHIDIVKFLELVDDKRKHCKRSLIIGNGGSGKSTLLKYLSRFYSQDGNREIRRILILDDEGTLKDQKVSSQYIPIFFRLRDLEGELKKYKQRDWTESRAIAQDFLL